MGVQGVHRARAKKGPGPRVVRAQGARKSSGFRVKFWYRTITLQSNLPTTKISVSLSSSLLVIGRYFCYTAFRASNRGRFD